MVKKTYLGIALVLVILSSSIYMMLPDNAKIVVENTRTKFYVWENEKWEHSATEYVYLYDGTTKMRAKSRDVSYITDGELTNIVRKSEWKDNITTIDTYVFNSSLTNVESIPISHTVQCINCVDKIVHFEYRDIIYDGITREAFSPESFGLRMKIEWQDGYEWAKLYQQKIASDKLIIRYKPDLNNVTYSVRMFDPPGDWWNSSYEFKRDITEQPISTLGFGINSTSGFCGEVIWANPRDDNISIYYNNCTDFKIIANDTSITDYEIESTGVGNNPSGVYNATNVYHFGINNSLQNNVTNDSSGGDDGIVLNNTKWISNGLYGGAFEYDGIDDLIRSNISNFNFSESWTLSYFVRLNIEGLKQFMVVLGDENGSEFVGLSYEINTAVKVSTAGKTPGNGVINLSKDIWYMNTIAWNGTDFLQYMDDVFDYSVTPTDNGTFLSDIDSMFVGTRETFVQYLNGSIDEVRIYDRELSPIEIEELYNNSIPGRNMNFGSEETEIIIEVTLNDPKNESTFISTDTIQMNFTVVYSHTAPNCSLYGNWTGTFEVNQTIENVSNNTLTNFDPFNLDVGDYIWNVACDETFATNNFTFTINNSLPTNVNITVPLNGTEFIFTGNNSIDFNFTATDIDNQTLTYNLFINETLNLSTTDKNVTVIHGEKGSYIAFIKVDDGLVNVTSDNVSYSIDEESINATLSENVSFSFNPENFTQSNVVPTGQTDSEGLFLVCSNSTISADVYMNMSFVNGRVDLKCDDDNTSSGASSISLLDTLILSGVAAGTCEQIWCWADFSNLQYIFKPSVDVYTI